MENYNIVVHYFWVVKLIVCILCLYVSYKAVITKKFKSTLWNTLAIILLVLMIISPIKLQIDTHSVHKAEEKAQEVLKVLPPKVQDESFKDGIKDLKGITKEDLK